MSKQGIPPRWADRFLKWYCNPELLEEIQGDAHELYYERMRTEGVRAANFKYIWDVIRFCRMSNVRRTDEFNEPGLFGIFWNLNMKIAVRNSMKNKTVFIVKLSALAICLAFTFLLAGFVINELTYDHSHKDYERIYRIGSQVELQGKTTDYAVSPLPLGPALVDEIPDVIQSSRFMFARQAYTVGEEKFFNITTYAADSNFLRMFTYEFIEGTPAALDEPGRAVLTESVAMRLFGDTHVTGKIIDLGWTEVEVGAVIQDLPLNTHFTFQALLSWDTFRREDVWDNVNAYTYIKLAPGVLYSKVDTTINSTLREYVSVISEEYGLKINTIPQRIDEIHLGGYLDEDFAPKRSRNYVYIIMSVVILFVLTGLFNYLNLALAELTTQIKKIAILRTFGGVTADHRKVALTDAILCLLIVAPLVVLIMALVLAYPRFLPAIDNGSWTSPAFFGLAGGLVVMILLCSSINSVVISKGDIMLSSLKGKSTGTQGGFTVRKILVAAQLSFSIVMIGLITVIFDQFSFVNEADKGFDDHDVIVLTNLGGYKESIVLEETIRGMAGVKGVMGSSFYPDAGVETKEMFSVETSAGMKNMLVNYINFEKEYPALLDLQLVAGRFFDKRSTDVKGAYLINETAAKEFGWSDPVGKRMEPENADNRGGEVIGVVKDFHFESMHSRIPPLIMFMADADWGLNFVYVKLEPAHPATLIESIEREYRKVLPDMPFAYEYLDARYRGLYKNDQEIQDIFKWGLIISIIVSGLGIFSISALLLSMKTKEMGIRKVVGAGNSDLFLRHLRPFATFFVIALLIGLPVVFYMSERWLSNFAYHIEMSAGYFVLPSLITIVIVLIASGYHAIMSARVNPVDILRIEN